MLKTRDDEDAILALVSRQICLLKFGHYKQLWMKKLDICYSFLLCYAVRLLTGFLSPLHLPKCLET